MDFIYEIWRSGYHDQPLQAGEGSEGDCGSEKREAERLPEVPSLPGERGLRGAGEPSRETEPQDHSRYHQRQRMGLSVFAVCVLQRALYRVQFTAYSHEDRTRHVL